MSVHKESIGQCSHELVGVLEWLVSGSLLFGADFSYTCDSVVSLSKENESGQLS